jgi:hypothetical protein
VQVFEGVFAKVVILGYCKIEPIMIKADYLPAVAVYKYGLIANKAFINIYIIACSIRQWLLAG